MISKTWPFPEGVPEKFESVESDPIANSEWCRICDALASRRMLSPAWGGVIYIASSAFADMKRLEFVMATYGRTEEFVESHAACLAQYLAACRDLTVTPDSSVRLTDLERVRT